MRFDPTHARIALARFAIAALSLYIRDQTEGRTPGMTLRQIAEAMIDADDAL